MIPEEIKFQRQTEIHNTLLREMSIYTTQFSQQRVIALIENRVGM